MSGRTRYTILLPVLTLVAAFISIVRSEPVTGRAPAVSRLDLFGDRLPDDALVRLGTSRFRHGSSIRQVSWSADGKSIYSAADGPGVRVWDAATGRELRRVGDRSVYSFAVGRDGKQLITAEEFGSLRVWNVASGREELPQLSPGAATPDDRVAREHEHITPVLISADGKTVACLRTQSHMIDVWDLPARRLTAEIRSESDSLLTALALAADGQTIIAGTSTGQLKTFSGDRGKLLAAVNTSSEPVLCLSVNRNGDCVSGAGDAAIRGWALPAGKMRFEVKPGGIARSLALAPDNETLAISWHDPDSHELRSELRSFRDGRRIRDLGQSPRSTQSLSFSPDGTTLAAASANTIVIYSVATGREQRPPIGHATPLTTTVFSRDGTKVATCSQHDRTAIVWDAHSGRELRRFADHPAGVDEVQFSPDGKLLATGCWDHPVYLWDVATGRLVHRIDEHPSVGAHFRFSTDGRQIATASHANVVGIWDCDSGRRVRECPAPGRGVASVLSFADGKLLVLEKSDDEVEDDDLPIVVWDAIAQRQIRRFAGHRGAINGAVLSRDGRMLASRGEDKAIRVWEVATGELRRSFSDPDEMSGWTGTQFLSFTSDNRILATCGSAVAKIRLWDIPGRRELPSLTGHRAWIGALDFAPDGKRLLTGSQDTTAMIWDIQGRLSPRQSAPIGSDQFLVEWGRLSSPDAAKAYDAVLRLIDGGDSSVALIRQRLNSVTPATGEQIAGWIKQLDHPQFGVRVRATAALVAVAGQAEEQLHRAAATGSAEVRNRVRKILEARYDLSQSGDRLREIRAVEALEAIATSRARELLRELAGGPEGAIATREARAAAARLERR